VQAVPTVIAMKDGKVIDRFTVLKDKNIEQFYTTHSLFHSRLETSLFCESFLPRSLLFFSSGFTTLIPQTVYCYF